MESSRVTGRIPTHSTATEASIWRKASYSTTNGGGCVEVADMQAAGIAVRDSKDPDGPRLAFAPDQWQAFTGHVKDGRFDLA